MSICTYCKSRVGGHRVEYPGNDNLAYPISVQVCGVCLDERGLRGAKIA